MKDGFRQSMAWLHTWAGLLVGWVLYFIFVTGTLGYFDTEIDRWMRPELPLQSIELTHREAIALGLRRLERVAPDASQWTVYPPSGHDVRNVSLFWTPASDAAKPGTTREELDNRTGRPIDARATGGGQQLYQMHYLLHYVPSRLAYWVVGACTMFMLVALVSGVITHRRIFKDFFTFRPRKGQRSWLDIHNVLSVFSLPFHLMITYSGLVFLGFTYMSLVVAATYGPSRDDRQRFFDEAFRNPDVPEAAGVAAPAAPIDAMLEEAAARWGPEQVRALTVYNPGDRNARVALTRSHHTSVSNGGRMVFDGVSGQLLDEHPRREGPLAVNDALLGLHEGLFAGTALRWLYFLSGLLGAAMVATGLVLWTAKRRRSAAADTHAGLALVERLNVGTVLGLPAAIAVYFWANRLLPVDLAERADWEAHAMFAAWAVMFVWTVLRPLARCWFEHALAGAVLLAGLPLLNALTTDHHLLATLAAKDWALAGFDLTSIAFALAFGYIAYRVRGARAQAPQTEVALGAVPDTEAA